MPNFALDDHAIHRGYRQLGEVYADNLQGRERKIFQMN
jgi:hypothetical protein